MEKIKQAATTIQEQTRQDIFPEYANLVSSRLESSRKGLALSEPESSSVCNFLIKSNFTPFPEFIHQQYDSLKCKSFMGIFPEINRVWVTIDNRLYLWNYAGTGENVINTFDDQEQIIVSVGLVKPLPGVFLEQIEYVLVVTTPIEIILLGLAFVSPSKENRGPLTIYRTDLTIASDNVNMISVAGTDKGRIFMIGNDGNLYEMSYQSEEGWFTRKVRKLNHSSSVISRLVIPPFLKWVTEDNLKSLVMDNARQCLYTLSKENSITLIYLGNQGQDYTKVSVLTGIYHKAVRFADQYSQFVLDERQFEIISLFPIYKTESQLVQLMGMTSSGHRLYFSHYRDFSHMRQESVGPSGLHLAFIRPPIGPSASYGLLSNSIEGSRSPQIHQAYYANGLLIACNSLNEEMDRLIGISLDCGAMSMLPNPKYLIEEASFLDLKGKTWSIVESNVFQSRLLLPYNSQNSSDEFKLNELSTQFESFPREFKILSNEGITTVMKCRPIDILFHLTSVGQDLKSFGDFFERFGRDQSCAMCLAIICRHECINLAQKDSVLPQITPNIINMATKLYFEMGGKPLSGQMNTRSGVFENGGLLGIPLSTFEIRYSSKHNGLVLYISRLIRPIWQSKVVKDQDKLESRFSVSELISIQNQLSSLDSFLGQYKSFTSLPTPENKPSGVDADAWRTEQESLAYLATLVKNLIETLSLLTLLIDYRLSLVCVGLKPEIIKLLKSSTFESLLTSVEGKGVTRELMSALVNHQIEDEMGVDVISNVLKMRCPSICQPNDVILYKGMELLKSAKASYNSQECKSILADAFQLFSSIAKEISLERLQDISVVFQSLNFYTGIVDLVLLKASFEDGDESVLSTSFYNRMESFKIIFNLLEFLNQLVTSQGESARKDKALVVKRALSCEDVTFHSCLYSWYIEKNWLDELLHMKSKYLETYLLSEKTIEFANLLWKFYVIHSRFTDAALILSELADSPGLDLVKRIEYLTMAVSNAKSSGSDSNSIVASLTDSLDVALIQQEILQIISNLPEYQESVIDLNSRFLDVNELYHKYARPLKLNEIILLILHTSNLGVQGRPIVEACWNELISKVIVDCKSNGRPLFDALKDKVRELGVLYYPDENVFPLKFIISKLQKTSFEMYSQGIVERGWLFKTLLEIKVSYHAIFSILHDLFETKTTPWSSNKALGFLIEDIYILLRDWIDFNAKASSSYGSFEQLDFPARFVDESISKYLVTISSDAKQLSSNLHYLQAKVRQRF